MTGVDAEITIESLVDGLPATPFSPSEHKELRFQLPEVQRCIYANAGTMGPVPRVSFEAQLRELELQASQRCDPTWPQRLGELQASVRALVARLLHVRPESVALMQATHPGINVALWGLALTTGENVVTTDEEHPGVEVPLRIQAERRGIAIRRVSFADAGSFVERAVAACDEHTRAVVVSHVSWLSGAEIDVAALGAALPDGVALIVDGAQSGGIVPIDLSSSWCTAYTVSGQKWSMGPNGSGALVVPHPSQLAPVLGAFMSVADAHEPASSPWQVDGRRFEFAQEAFGPLAGWQASLEWLLDHVQVERAYAHAQRANQLFRRCLDAAYSDHGVAAPAVAGNAHLAVVPWDCGNATDVVADLWKLGISVRDLGPAAIRVSFGYWLTDAEIATIASTLADLAARA